ncbi:NUDIX hydrolase [Acidipropionibacterium jensenii]|uniref:NUDIX hydrolase n=1 Tax=Acidipropionibacterium jensenii TaxID=1749 RepID=A0A3T0RYA1_9ACTN|nr:NUDIX hydrolase [Acidipropionibacterium jensenii]AZZ39073.1 NUDIX hydrolase [Acidipropionibacterium jensenii]
MIDEELLFTSDNMSIVRRVRDVRGVRQTFDIARRPQIVIGVLSDDASGGLVLVRQHREAIRRTTLEFPAGKIEPGEDVEIAMRREISEEAGMTVDKIVRIGRIWTAPHFSDEFATVFVGTGKRVGPSLPTPKEDFDGLVLVRPSDVASYIADGTLRDAKSLAAWALFESTSPGGPENA